MANPFIAMQAEELATTIEELPLLEEYAWDFEHDTFIRDANGNLKIVYGNDALKVWIYKCLKTERYRYNVYIHGKQADTCHYGVYLEKYLGAYPNNERTATLVKKEIFEAISANPYIEKINYIEIHELKHENLTLNIDLASIYGDFSIKNLTV